MPYGDLTTHALGIGGARGRLSMVARSAMTVCCVEEAERMFAFRGCEVTRFRTSGEWVDADTPLLAAAGSAAQLHATYKVAQTLMEYASGIATRAGRIVAAARSVNPRIPVASTRKHFPGAKVFSTKAILAGGAVVHRLGLSETLLVFPEHGLFLQSEEALKAAFARARTVAPEKKLVAEAETVRHALRLAALGVDVIQVDKLLPADVKSLVEALAGTAPRPAIAATGGITESNAADYAAAGADLLVTSAPYSAAPLDVKVKWSLI
jgi:molybdenum transport protein